MDRAAIGSVGAATRLALLRAITWLAVVSERADGAETIRALATALRAILGLFPDVEGLSCHIFGKATFMTISASSDAAVHSLGASLGFGEPRVMELATDAGLKRCLSLRREVGLVTLSITGPLRKSMAPESAAAAP